MADKSCLGEKEEKQRRKLKDEFCLLEQEEARMIQV